MKRRTFLRCALLAAAGGLADLPGRTLPAEVEWHERVRPLMGSFTGIAVGGLPRSTADKLIDDCFAYLEGRVAAISSWNPASETSRLNRERRIARSDCSPAFRGFLELAAQARRLTGGRFEPLGLGLTERWRSAKAAGAAPDPADIRAELSSLAAAELHCGADGYTLLGGRIDCGGFGKGLAADWAAAFLRRRGVRLLRIDCGGDLRFSGAGTWNIDVQAPEGRGWAESFVARGDCGIATSGDYNNSWEAGGTRYHHLIDPRTGQPARGCRSATVMCRTAATADALATAAFLLPPRDSRRWLEGLPGVEGLLLGVDGERHMTRGMRSMTRGMRSMT